MDQLDINNLFDYNGTVDELDFDDELKEHLSERGTYDKHIVSILELSDVLHNNPRFFLNGGEGRRAPLIMVGYTQAGRWLCVPMEPTTRRGVWHPVTAFEANAHHRAKYDAEGAD